jgi:hypothetical protein
MADKLKVLLVLPDEMSLLAIPIVYHKLQSGMYIPTYTTYIMKTAEASF